MKALVLGLGISGRSVVRFLHSLDVQVAVSESRPADRLTARELKLLDSMGVALETGGHSTRFLGDADLVVAGPGVPAEQPVLEAARRRGIPVLGELALAAGRFQVPVIAVTGSNGKTTVTGLIGSLLAGAGHRVFVGGNIGTPLLDYCTDQVEAEVAVLELSSFQLERAGGFRPDVALLLNITPDHLDRHGSMAQYAAEKYKIFAHQQPGDTAILGGDDSLVMAVTDRIRSRRYTFGVRAGSTARIMGSRILVSGENGTIREYNLAGTRLDTAVNRLNAAAAILAARAVSCGAESVWRGLAAFRPPEHRMSVVAEKDGVTFINDSKATNVGALAAALASCRQQVVLIVGGRDKGSDFSVLREIVAKKVRQLILIGEAADILDRALSMEVAVRRAASMEEAVRLAVGVAKAGDTVLLAPGCASFDMFTDYAERGRVFARIVDEYCFSPKTSMRKKER